MRCVKDLTAWLESEYTVSHLMVNHEFCPPEIEGDITINCFRFAKSLKRNPMEVAARVTEFLSSHGDVRLATCTKAFVNVTLETAALFGDTVADREALLDTVLLPEAERCRILIEYPAPNSNKPLHLGHVRNIALGSSIVAILARVGHESIPVNLVNDRGIHISKSMIAYERWGEGTDPQKSGTKGDHLVGDFYVKYNAALQDQLAALRKDDPSLEAESDDALFERTEIGAAAQEMLKKWEAGDSAVRELWEKMNRWALDGFDQTFARTGVAFEKIYLESETYKLGKKIVDRGLEEGLFERRDDGAVVVDLESVKLGTKVLLRPDGTSVYMTQDLGTTDLKHKDFEPHRQIWIVGDEQIHHFKVLFAILGTLGYGWADKLHHMAYGMVDLPTGKMKGREGTVVDADDLFDEMEALARLACEAACTERGDALPEDIDHRARVIGQGALKFWLLKFKPRSRILFDPAQSINLKGDTGPYVQYACARISSILAKEEVSEGRDGPSAQVDWSVLDRPEERNLALRCADYGRTVRRAAADLDPSVLADYLLSLAKEFSRFYRACPVLNADSPSLRTARLALCASVLELLRDGLSTLTIDYLESM